MAYDVLASGAPALLSGKVVGGGVRDILAPVHTSALVAMNMASCKLVWKRLEAFARRRQSWSHVSPSPPGLAGAAGVGSSYGGGTYLDTVTDTRLGADGVPLPFLLWLSAL